MDDEEKETTKDFTIFIITPPAPNFMCDEFESKYYPQTFDDFLENESAKSLLLSYEKDFIAFKYPLVLLQGKYGTGKSALVYLYAKHTNRQIIAFEENDISDKKTFLHRLQQFLKFNGRHTLILFDNVDKIFQEQFWITVYKLILKEFTNVFLPSYRNKQEQEQEQKQKQKYLLPQITFPRIILTSSQLTLKKAFIKANILNIPLEHPSYNAILSYLHIILAKEQLTYDEAAIELLVKRVKCNLRQCFTILKLLSIKTQHITCEIIKRALQTSAQDEFYTSSSYLYTLIHDSSQRQSAFQYLNTMNCELNYFSELLLSNLPYYFIEWTNFFHIVDDLSCGNTYMSRYYITYDFIKYIYFCQVIFQFQKLEEEDKDKNKNKNKSAKKQKSKSKSKLNVKKKRQTLRKNLLNNLGNSKRKCHEELKQIQRDNRDLYDQQFHIPPEEMFYISTIFKENTKKNTKKNTNKNTNKTTKKENLIIENTY